VKKTYRIAVIPGDASAKEVAPEGCARSKRPPGSTASTSTSTGSISPCVEYYEKHGRMMPPDWKPRSAPMTRSFSAPSAGPPRSRITYRYGGSLVTWRREFDQYVNLRPVRLMPGVPCPLVAASPATSTSTWCVSHEANIPSWRTHHVEVDVAGLAAHERAGDTGHQPHRPQVDVLVELAPPCHQRAHSDT